MSSAGLQAIILCGPGEGLNPFNSNPKDFPKALIPIANRPMIWYPLEWCHRAAVSSITLITAPKCTQALEAALAQNPYLTSLPSAPRTTILTPHDLNLTTGTAEIFRLPEVQSLIVGDYLVLPCDLICEVSGRALWEAWSTLQSPSLGSSLGSSAQKGGMGVWYDTKDATEDGVGVKKEETDLLVTTNVTNEPSLASVPAHGLLQHCLRELALVMPTDTLNDEMQEKEYLRVRTQLLRKKGKVKTQVKTRDAHMYFMPHWSKEYVRRNKIFESFGEDVVGWLAKARWQRGLEKKLGIDEALQPSKRRTSSSGTSAGISDDGLDLEALSSTGISNMALSTDDETEVSFPYASRVGSGEHTSHQAASQQPPHLPAFLAYTHPPLYVPSESNSSPQQAGQKQRQQAKGGQQQALAPAQPPSQLIRRIDTVKLLLSASLYLARLPTVLASLPSAPPPSAHPFCHSQQVHSTSALPSQATIPTQSVLIDANCTLQPRITIRDSVVGANCSIGSGSRLHGCLLMEGVVIEERVLLNGCVLGRRCKVSAGSELRDCQLEDGYVVPENTTTKGEVLAGFDEGASPGDEEE